MRGQWFTDGTWLPLEEDESDHIEMEHLARCRGQQMRDTYEMEVLRTAVDSKDGEARGAPVVCVCGQREGSGAEEVCVRAHLSP